MPTPYPVKAIADYFIGFAEPETGDVMTHLRLQKLAYYAQGWHLALAGKRLFDSPIEAWPHGPVSPELWAHFRDYGMKSISGEDITTDSNDIDAGTRKILDDVWSVYGQFTAKRLEDMTHDESPWINARNGLPPAAKSNNRLSEQDMKEYFSALLKNAERS